MLSNPRGLLLKTITTAFLTKPRGFKPQTLEQSENIFGWRAKQRKFSGDTTSNNKIS